MFPATACLLMSFQLFPSTFSLFFFFFCFYMHFGANKHWPLLSNLVESDITRRQRILHIVNTHRYRGQSANDLRVIQQNSILLRDPVNERRSRRQLQPSYTRPASNRIRCGAIFTASTQSDRSPGACWMVWVLGQTSERLLPLPPTRPLCLRNYRDWRLRYSFVRPITFLSITSVPIGAPYANYLCNACID